MYPHYYREQLRRGGGVPSGEAAEELEGFEGLLRASHRAGAVRAEGDRDRRTGDARHHGAQEQGQGWFVFFVQRYLSNRLLCFIVAVSTSCVNLAHDWINTAVQSDLLKLLVRIHSWQKSCNFFSMGGGVDSMH